MNKVTAIIPPGPVAKSDLNILKDCSKWLNCKFINAGQFLMKKRFPAVQGLHDVTLSRTLSFPSHDRPFVQILNCAESHWICASNIGCKPNSIKVYDSNVTGNVPSSTKDALATLMCSQAKVIHILYPDVQQQMDNSGCGLYALAYAYTLCEGKNPTNVAYSEVNLRSHLLLCIKRHAVSSFSCGRALYLPGKPKSSKFKIYCSCRLRDAGDEMIKCSKCKEWFHYTCVDLEPGTKIKESWLCAKCIL